MKILNRTFLPPPTASVHAASIAFYKDHPVFAWFGGSKEGAQDISIYLYNLNNDGKYIIIGDKDSIPRWNPILVPIKDSLILFEKSGIFCDRWTTFVHDISDWTNDVSRKEILETAYILPAGLNGPVKSCPLVNEHILTCGSSVETMYDWTSYIETYHIDYKTPNVLTYQDRSKPLGVKNKKSYQDPFSGMTNKTLGIIQPTLWTTYDKNGKEILHAFFRSSKGLDKIYYSDNHPDKGWSDPVPTNLDNPNSAVDVVCKNRKIYLVHNPDKTYRHPLVLSEIKIHEYKDHVNCEIIDQITITEKVGENIPLISSELSYPYMIEHNGNLHLVYTYGRRFIEHLTIEI